MASDKHDSTKLSAPHRPTIALPPRPSFDSLFGAPASPGPMTLVSSFFADSDHCSFSQLLAGAMASPLARTPVSFMALDNQNSSKEEDGGDKNSGFKQSRPANLVVARSPMFTVPPGLSPSGLLNSPGFFSPQGPFGMSHQQALAQVTAQAALAQSHMQFQAEYPPSSGMIPSEQVMHHTSFASMPTMGQQHMMPLTSDRMGPSLESSEMSHSDKKPPPAPVAVDKPADDGYNWRKYGQKQVKGSEYPRSYYKCTHLNCPVKKKVERSLDGQITEIIYKGQHNHDMPQPNKRSKDGSDPNASMNPQAKQDHGLHIQDRNSNGSAHPRDHTAPMQITALSDSEDVDDAETRGEDGDNDEPCPKRRNTEAGTADVVSPHKSVTEPRIIVQTRSEVDLLDDGYRWRKYGQKVVKGNPHPRSYYKCTYAGCNVRKHVERAPTDPKAVITTYEGKHNHDVPAARSGSHNSANSNAPNKVVAEKHSFLKGMDFGNNDQRPVVLQLKEEEIAV